MTSFLLFLLYTLHKKEFIMLLDIVKNELNPTVLINDIHKNNDTFYDVISRLNITKVDQQVISIPDKSNDYHGVVTATITTKNSNSYTGIGESYSSEQLPKEQVLQNAQLIAFKNAVCNAVIAVDDSKSNNSDVIDITPTKSYTNYKNNNKKEDIDKSKMNGGGNKPITEKQIGLINSMAEKQGRTGDYYAKKICNKNLENLTGKDANRIIQEIKNEPY